MRIRTKLLAGFALTIGISGAMGLYAAHEIGRASSMTSDLYDKPAMAADFSRSALENFLRLDRATTDIMLKKDRAALGALPKTIAAMKQAVLDDLGIAQERFSDRAGASLIGDVRTALGQWLDVTQRLGEAELAASGGEPDAKLEEMLAEREKLLKQAELKFDILVEGAKAEGLTFREDAAAVGASTLLLIKLAVAGNLVAGLLVALLLARGIAQPITRITSTMTKLAGGESDIEVPAIGRSDEVGEMAKAVGVFRENMIKAEELVAERRAEQERKEQRQKVIEGYIAEFDKSVRDALDTLASAATEMRATATSMSETAEETQRQAGTVASASEQTSANVQTVAASSEEMSSSIGEIGRQVTQASQIAKRAVEDAQRTNVTVNTLADAAQKIGQVVQLIQDIASQTNLLALNATIEAARAGDAGKGFAVVASEVKSLANQTAKATEDIAAQIGSIQSVTSEAVTAIQGIGGTIAHINEISTAIASAVEEQGAATQEIARNTQQAAKGTEQVSANIAGVNSTAAETGAAASQVLSSAEQLGRQSETLRGEVNRFLEKIRAA